MKKIVLILLLGILPLAASAQKETGIFVGATTGMNVGFDGLQFQNRAASHIGAGFNGDFFVGAFLNEIIGLRAGYQGFTTSDRYTNFGNRKYNYVHGDLLLRVHRNIVPYVHGGFVSIVNPGFGGGVGLMLPIHLGKNVSIVPDLKANLFSGKAFATEQPKLAGVVSGGLGIAYRFGRARKVQETEPEVIVPPLTPVIEEVKDTIVVVPEVQHDTIVVQQVQHDTVYVKEVLEPETISGLALFDTNKSELRAEVLNELDKIAAWFISHPDAKAVIEGHTDKTASAAYNQALSERRAQAVYDYLVSKGVAADRLSYCGYGFSQPVATNDTPEGRQQNRRVEIKVE